MMPPTPQQSSHSSMEEMQGQAEMEVQGSMWSARERTVIAEMENNLDKSDDMKVEVEELELGPRRLRSRSDVHPDAGKQEEQQIRNVQYQ